MTLRTCFSLTQDVLENEQIKLDSMFKFSLMQDVVRVCIPEMVSLWHGHQCVFLFLTTIVHRKVFSVVKSASLYVCILHYS